MASLVMGIMAKTFLRLTNVVVYQNLGHQLNLGLHFCWQFKAMISYEGDQPCIEIQGEKHPLVDSLAAERGDSSETRNRRSRGETWTGAATHS
ncbi:MAG: hypothetical protein GY696_14260 [Gammaproteobacteria bacterium]|nr:hypothetical protein [Gammaproteobacteria bacterium]